MLALVPAALLDLWRHPDLRVEVTELALEASLPALAGGDFDLAVAEEYPGHPLPAPTVSTARTSSPTSSTSSYHGAGDPCV